MFDKNFILFRSSYCHFRSVYLRTSYFGALTSWQKKTCKDCNSLACPFSPNYKPVARWRCYQKKYQNEKV